MYVHSKTTITLDAVSILLHSYYADVAALYPQVNTLGCYPGVAALYSSRIFTFHPWVDLIRAYIVTNNHNMCTQRPSATNTVMNHDCHEWSRDRYKVTFETVNGGNEPIHWGMVGQTGFGW